MVFHIFQFLLVVLLFLSLALLGRLFWPYLQHSHAQAGGRRALVHRLLKPRTPVLAIWDIRSSNGRKGEGMRSREEVTFVGRMLFELVPSGSLAEQEARLHTQHGPLECATKSSCLRAREEEQDMPKTLLGVLGMIAEPTGTDGLRLLCRQFYTSSNYPLQPSIVSSKSSFQKSRHLLSLRRSGDQGRKTFPTAFQKISGQLSFSVSLKTMSPTAGLQTTTVSHTKRSDAWLAQLISCKQNKAFLQETSLRTGLILLVMIEAVLK